MKALILRGHSKFACLFPPLHEKDQDGEFWAFNEDDEGNEGVKKMKGMVCLK
jgi:hypothetical protein